MHELSIAHSLVEIATEHAQNAGAEKVVAITVRVGVLSCIQKSALCAGFEMFADDTLLKGATLQFVDVPVTVYCDSCERAAAITDLRSIRCPSCGNVGSDVRNGRELEVESIEIIESVNLEIDPTLRSG